MFEKKLYDEGGIEPFLLYIKCGGRMVSGELLEFFINKGLNGIRVIDEGYEPFDYDGGSTIGYYYILDIGGKLFRVWEEVDLTGIWSNEWYDQELEEVEQIEKVVKVWRSK